MRLWKKTSEGSISTVFVEKHPPFRQHPAWILTLVSVLTLRQMDGSLDFSLLLRDPLPLCLMPSWISACQPPATNAR